MKRAAFYLFSLIFSARELVAQPAIVATFSPRSHSYLGTTLPYRLFVPAGYASSVRYPIVLAMHGSGESGTDNISQLTANRLATSWADPVNQAKYPCFVVAPQCPASAAWTSNILANANNILDSLAREFSIDTNRMYVTGLSLGGYGTWEAIASFPGRFAAAIPMSGGGNPSSVANFIGTPIWNFHGTVDPTVPVQQSRAMIDALRQLGRGVVYTHCQNAYCAGLPDSVIAIDVQSHADLFYTEYQNGGHVIWNESYDYPHLFPWVFDQYRNIPGAITLTNLGSHRTLTGAVPITWTTTSPGDSVEIWFSPDLGDSRRLISRAEPNTGTYTWNTLTAGDCSFGEIELFLKNTEGHIYGRCRSGFFTISNSTTGVPFVKILNDGFTTGSPFTSDSLDIPLLFGDSRSPTLPAAILYSPDGGTTFVQTEAFTARSDSNAQTRRIRIAPLANSPAAVLRVVVSNGSLIASSFTSPFPKQTPRKPGPKVDHVQGIGGTTLSIDIVDPAALTGHRYRVTFNDTSSLPKSYDVLDVDRGLHVVHQARQMDGITEGPLFDGIRLNVNDPLRASISPDSTRWVDGHTTLHANVFVVSRVVDNNLVTGFPDPYDYRILPGSTVVDTSKAGFGIVAAPMKFSVWNLTRNRKADVLFYDSDGNQTISTFDEVDILEPDSSGKPRLSWGIYFVDYGGDTLPGPGSMFLLKTIKPATAADVFEFNAIATSVSREAVPTRFSLDQNYPNPFNPTTTIRFAVPAARFVSLKVYDILGREVATLVNELREGGEHLVTWDASRFASGVYICRINAGEFVAVKKLMLLK